LLVHDLHNVDDFRPIVHLPELNKTMGYPNGAAKLLDDLGHDTDAVANTLRSHEVRGIRNAVRQLNPICRYIQKNGVGITQATIQARELLILTFSDERRQEVQLPAAVRDFLAAFDRGLYPDLILPPEAV
jgi:hypothetical protein